jgi:hypothetical protein
MAITGHQDDMPEDKKSPSPSIPTSTYSWERLAPQKRREVLKMLSSQSRERKRRLILTMVVLLFVLGAIVAGAFYLGVLKF